METLTQNKFLTDDELKTLLSRLKEEKGSRNAIIIGLILYTGARQCEITTVKPSDICNGCVTIYGRKNSNDGVIPLPPHFYKDLVKYASQFKDCESMFQYNTSTLRRIWYKFTPNHKKGLHSLRHTFGVKFYNNTTDILGVKRVLRHKNIKNTMKYLDFVEGTKKTKKQIKGMWSNKLDDVA